MIPDIQSIIAMLLAGECTAERAEAWIYTHMENSDLRDQFAGMAMQGMIAKGMDDYEKKCGKGVPFIAKFAYEYADAMLKARKA